MTHILKAKLFGGIEGRDTTEYRAVLERAELGATIRIEQPIKDEWHATGGGWYIETLLTSTNTPRVNDSLWIDYGQKWVVTGIDGAVWEALLYLAAEHKTEEAMIEPKAQYLVVTNVHSWGRGVTLREARSQAFKNNYCGKKECKFVAYYFPADVVEDFGCDEMGSVFWEWSGEPVEGFAPRMGLYHRGKNGHIKAVDEHNCDSCNDDTSIDCHDCDQYQQAREVV